MDFSLYKNRILNISQYLMASILPLALNLVSNPFIAKNMSSEDYAIVGYHKSFNTLILPLILFYVLHYYTKRYYELDDKRRLELKANVFKFLISASFLTSIFCIIGIYIYTYLFNKNSQIPLFPYVFINVFSLPLTGIYSMTLVDYRMSRLSKEYLWLSLKYSLSSIFVLVLLVVIVKWGAFGNLISIFIVNLFFFIYCCFKNKELFFVKIKKDSIKEMLLFCYPLTLAAMLGFFSNGFDRVYLERLGNVSELGLYVVAFSIASNLSVFSNAVSSTFQPDIYKSIANRNIKRFFQYTILVLIANLFTVVVFVVFAPFIIDLLTAGRYIAASKYLQIMAVMSFAQACYFSISQLTVALGFTKITLYNNILSSLFCIIMFQYVINNWQFIGASWGLSLTYFISFLGNIILLIIYYNKVKITWKTPVF